jgi:MFS family permease
VTEPGRRIVIPALGLTQILAWGSSFYLLAVLAKPIAADTGWSMAMIVGGVSLGLLAGGFAMPTIGRMIDARGGGPVLASSSVLLGLGLGLLGSSGNLAMYAVAWLVIGLGMGAGLYDAAFATLGRAYGADARSAIVALTLWAGFASTVCWPLSAYLVGAYGWRIACFVYAGLQLGFSLPVHLCLMPRNRADPADKIAVVARSAPLPPEQRRTFLLFALLVTLGGAIASAVSVHLLVLLQARGVELAAAVALGALVGPAQVGARVVEMTLGRRFHPIWTLAAATVLIGAAVTLLLIGRPVIALALVLYGAGNGIWSIARGTLPLALFGSAGYPTLIGRLGLPFLLAQALSPSIAALILDRFGAGPVLAVLAGLALANIGLTGALAIVLRQPASTV